MEAVLRIALIHALAHSIAPINAELDRSWPACVRMNLLDDSLAADLARGGTGLDVRLLRVAQAPRVGRLFGLRAGERILLPLSGAQSEQTPATRATKHTRTTATTTQCPNCN